MGNNSWPFGYTGILELPPKTSKGSEKRSPTCIWEAIPSLAVYLRKMGL